LLSSATAVAQQPPPLKVPEVSPAASISQTVGLTDIKVTYHRPAVGVRKVGGGLVPYGEVWRAGANENTTITFSTAVKVGGKALHAGTYGVHMIPTAKDWTVIFSNQSKAWGSFGYSPKEDALRVTVTPQSTEMPEERLVYTFEEPTETQTLATLRWEKLKVPIKIEVDTPQIVMASMREELRGVHQFFPAGWAQAAQYWVRHNGNLDEAMKLVERSIAIQPNFQNTMTRAAVLEKKGDGKGAADLRGKALAMGNENDVNNYGYQLLAQKRIEDAIAIFERNVEAHPASWNVHDSLGEAYLAKGDKKAATDNYEKALKLVKDAAQRKRIEKALADLKGK
jgi:hypothetical protein